MYTHYTHLCINTHNSKEIPNSILFNHLTFLCNLIPYAVFGKNPATGCKYKLSILENAVSMLWIITLQHLYEEKRYLVWFGRKKKKRNPEFWDGYTA